MLYDKVEIEGIKLAVGGMETIGHSGKEVLLRSIVWLCENYERNGEDEFLEKAVWHIYAYLELGFPYNAGEKVFERVKAHLGGEKGQTFLTAGWRNSRVPLTKGNVNRLLGRWNPKLHSMKIDDAVLDIIQKVEEKKQGEYTYHSGKIIQRGHEKTLWEHTYRLYVSEKEAVFYDVSRNKYYLFEE